MFQQMVFLFMVIVYFTILVLRQMVGQRRNIYSYQIVIKNQPVHDRSRKLHKKIVGMVAACRFLFAA